MSGNSSSAALTSTAATSDGGNHHYPRCQGRLTVHLNTQTALPRRTPRSRALPRSTHPGQGVGYSSLSPGNALLLRKRFPQLQAP